MNSEKCGGDYYTAWELGDPLKAYKKTQSQSPVPGGTPGTAREDACGPHPVTRAVREGTGTGTVPSPAGEDARATKRERLATGTRHFNGFAGIARAALVARASSPAGDRGVSPRFHDSPAARIARRTIRRASQICIQGLCEPERHDIS
jgi:hypothetical protein